MYNLSVEGATNFLLLAQGSGGEDARRLLSEQLLSGMSLPAFLDGSPAVLVPGTTTYVSCSINLINYASGTVLVTIIQNDTPVTLSISAAFLKSTRRLEYAGTTIKRFIYDPEYIEELKREPTQEEIDEMNALISTPIHGNDTKTAGSQVNADSGAHSFTGESYENADRVTAAD